MTLRISSGNRLGGVVLPLVLMSLVSGCASVHGGYGPGSGVTVANDSHYKTGTMKPYTVRGHTYYPSVPDVGFSETGLASWYGYESPNQTTADGERFDTDLVSAAHKTFPLPSVVEVLNLDTGKSIRVRVNDRGPFVDGRIIDLTRGAAKAIGAYTTGTARVRITWLGPADLAPSAPPTIDRPSSESDDGLNYIVQIGAFADKDNADATEARLAGSQIRQQGDLYIVYVGPYVGASEAESHRQIAIDAGFADAILKRDK